MQRQIVGTPDVRFIYHVKQDILEHRNDPEYDTLYFTAKPDSKHNFRVRVEGFPSLDLDNDEWLPRLITAFAHFDQAHPLGVPFIVNRICKPECTRDHSKPSLLAS
ncbi:unnamed protein product [Penicillium salamii]|nr:unnamed protein product [Penicillium salamii]